MRRVDEGTAEGMWARRTNSPLGNEESREYDADDEWHLSIGGKKWATESTNGNIWAATAYGRISRGETPEDDVEVGKGRFQKGCCYILTRKIESLDRE